MRAGKLYGLKIISISASPASQFRGLNPRYWIETIRVQKKPIYAYDMNLE